MIFLNVYFFYIFIREKQGDTKVNVVHLSSQAPPTAGVSQHYAGQKTILTETGDRNKLWMFLLSLEKKPTISVQADTSRYTIVSYQNEVNTAYREGSGVGGGDWQHVATLASKLRRRVE